MLLEQKNLVPFSLSLLMALLNRKVYEIMKKGKMAFPLSSGELQFSRRLSPILSKLKKHFKSYH